ncbi:MAG: ATP-dependent protease ATPase subunit HslU [Spirochaetes bacterium]|jgi:ATP-dependent HslUV protease ATP-binding subunit HslU|nr:ATP-dependent protease ATPase subunit HslU [Spirochaetota bacterium]
MKRKLDELTPQEIVSELDNYVIGQERAKKAVAIALRNRLRRQRLSDDLRDEVAPKNIIMIGPTGVGKTEIARRISKLTGAPFIKVEATKYTEVGYVGRDVESMVRDLTSFAVSMVKSELQEEVREEAEKRTEEAVLDLLLPGSRGKSGSQDAGNQGQSQTQAGFAPSPQSSSTPATSDSSAPADTSSATREKFRRKLRNSELEDKEVEIQVSQSNFPAIEIFSGSNFEEMDLNLGNLGNIFGGKKKKKRTSVKEARETLLQDEMDKLVDQDRVSELARRRVEEMGIIFIDEIDKIAAKENRGGVDVSREGVQRDILPIVEGSKINTKHGLVDTSHILFVAAGAFHTSKPSDLIPELQGRFPLRVELEALGSEEFYRILTQPQNALIRQYTELLKTEEVELEFTEDAIRRICDIAADVNSKTENIGARRLHTIMEHLLEEVSFTATELTGQKIPITPEYVNERLSNIVEDQDLSRYIL